MGYNPVITPSRAGQAEQVATFIEESSMSFVVGEVVYSHATTGDILPNTTLRAGSNWGIAQKAATNVTSGWAQIGIQVFEPGMTISCSTTTAGTDVDASTFVPGLRYGWYVASNLHEADLAAVGTDDMKHVLIFLRAIETPNGSTSYRGLFRLHATGCSGSHDAT
jgi:hypothetical protein